MCDRILENGDVGGEVAAASPVISLRDVSKEFKLRRGETLVAVSGVSFDVASGEFLALIGPSGCGKSTLLRLVGSLEVPSRGTVVVNGRQPAELAAAHRLGVAFQDHALLPWLNSWDNIALPFHVAGMKPDKQRIAELISLVGMAGFEKARPKQLSGGMRQRIAIARALALNPEVLLLDEPFGALDAVTRRQMNLELQRIWSAQQHTTILVTHSVDEALFLADRVIVLTERPGQVKFVKQVEFERPRTRELATTAEFHAIADELTLALDSTGT
ncbi:MAG: ABC transporter ATP-binding protein [bacterium]|nr:ABC transporter ATP-binding protein [bacterium]MDE0374348.1 ABC transporter ATP-binding protein [bacterium]